MLKELIRISENMRIFVFVEEEGCAGMLLYIFSCECILKIIIEKQNLRITQKVPLHSPILSKLFSAKCFN